MLPSVETGIVTSPRLLHVSMVVGGDLVDSSGAKLGRVDDLIVRLGEDEYPRVTGVLASVAGRQVFVPAEQLDAIEHGRTGLRAVRLDLRPFERRPAEV